MTTYQFFTTAPGAVQSRAHLSKTSCMRISRLSLLSPAGRDGRASASEGKRVGLGEGRLRVCLGSDCVCSSQTPHLNPLPSLKGRGDRDHSTNVTFR